VAISLTPPARRDNNDYFSKRVRRDSKKSIKSKMAMSVGDISKSPNVAESRWTSQFVGPQITTW
jgi:hypothetical protein